MEIYKWRICSASSILTQFDFTKVIDITHIESSKSPIDQFIIKNKELNSLILDPNNFKNQIEKLHNSRKISKTGKIELNKALFNAQSISPVFANLILLGHISAVESYFRAIFRRLILIDDTVQKTCYKQQLNYGAVLVHDKDSLPDALLELISFSSRKNIEETLRNFFGVKGQLPISLEPILDEFARVCQLRHCIIHKFGIIGSNNIDQDVNAHKSYINKPIKTDFASIQEVSQICWNVVHEINQLLWQNTITRTFADYQKKGWQKKPTYKWKWKWKNDKYFFKKYYSIFISHLSPPSSSDMKIAYDDLENNFKTF